uniref:G-protein coupled receptors family 1 profile domain-containing protein n=1 Tax=Ditylenchus dipsaci TaxID=166011 RepID=A0A915D1W4_9BILA
MSFENFRHLSAAANLSAALFRLATPSVAAPQPTTSAILTFSMESTENLDEEEQLCGEYENYTPARFLFLSISSIIAVMGVFANIFLCILFSLSSGNATTSSQHKTPPTLYPRILALLDTIICLVYILIFGGDAVMIYLHVKSLFTLYHTYIVPAFVISRIAQIAIPYMLIFATLERFVWIAGNMRNRILKRMYSVHGRYVTVAISLLICICLRLPTAWATRVYDYPKCEDFFEARLQLPLPGSDSTAFFCATYFQRGDNKFLRLSNYSTPDVAVERSNSVRTSSVAASLSESLMPIHNVRKSLSTIMTMNTPVKSAIYTMVCIVASYLLSNTLHLILTVLERSNSDLLKHPTDPNLASTFHTIFSDMVSFVYMFTSAMRCVIYYVCNPTIRGDIQGAFKHMCHRTPEKGEEKTDTNNSTML